MGVDRPHVDAGKGRLADIEGEGDLMRDHEAAVGRCRLGEGQERVDVEIGGAQCALNARRVIFGRKAVG